MPRQPWSTTQFDFPTLRVSPSIVPPNRRDYDIIYCLSMVTDYMSDEYSDREVRLKTYAPTIDEIVGHMRTDELGWTPNQADLNDISALTSSLHFSLDSWTGTPPKGLIKVAEETLLIDLPLIAYIDDLQLRRGVRESGPLHAVVIVGVDSDGSDAAIADPWTGGLRKLSKENLEDAWDPMHHQIVQVKPRLSSESHSGTNQ